MPTTYFHLENRLPPAELRRWYSDAEVGDDAVIRLPGQNCIVRLLRSAHGYVRWWPEGERGVTVSFEDAVSRLQMLCGPAEA